MMLWLRGPNTTWVSWQTSHSQAPLGTAAMLASADQAANEARQQRAWIPEYTFFEAAEGRRHRWQDSDHVDDPGHNADQDS